MMNEKEYWYWFCNLEGLGLAKQELLLNAFGDPEAVYKADLETIIKKKILDDKEIKSLNRSGKEKEVFKGLETVYRSGAHFIHIGHPDYPERFNKIPDRPMGLYYKGSLPDRDRYAVGMVGARSCSEYGRHVALQTSGILASNDIQIISGLALGIDSFSSEGAIKRGGKTFAVLGTGLDIIYPRENTDLYYRILMNGGGIISEFPFGTQGQPWHFPHRNRLISALSDKLLIVEARRISGTLTTAQHALLQGIDIYAVPGRISDPLSEGCNKLIADGCGIFTGAQYFMEDIFSKPVRCCSENFSFTRKKQRKRKSKNNQLTEKNIPENNRGKAIFRSLGFEQKPIDKIIEETGLPLEDVVSELTEMSIQGIVEEVSKDVFRIS